jgi:diacylglycerol kinase family enzyme
VTIDGATFECEGLAAVVANSASIGVGGASLVGDADISDGVLDFIVLQDANLPSLIGSVADVAQGQEPRGLLRWRGKEIRVEANPQQVVLIDGEEAGSTPVEVGVAPEALGVLVPKMVSAVPA